MEDRIYNLIQQVAYTAKEDLYYARECNFDGTLAEYIIPNIDNLDDDDDTLIYSPEEVKRFIREWYDFDVNDEDAEDECDYVRRELQSIERGYTRED